MRALISFSLVVASLTAGAHEVLPTTAVCEVLLRTAAASARGVDRGAVLAMYEAYKAYKTNGHRNVRSLSDVRTYDPAPRGLLAHARDPGPFAGVDIVAKEFVGEGEIARALEVLRTHVDKTALPVTRVLDALYPPARVNEVMRLGLWVAATAGPVLTGQNEVDFVHAPLVIAATYLGAARRKRVREERFGVPRLAGQLALIDRALVEARELAPADRRRVLSVVRATVPVDLATHKVLFDRGEEDLSRRDFDRLVESARPLRSEWSDLDSVFTRTRDILVESVVFSEESEANPRLRWLILVRGGTPPGAE